MINTVRRHNREQVGVNARVHVTWTCTVQDPRHRPGGLRQTEGCGWTNVLSTTKNLTTQRTQCRCSNPNCTPEGKPNRRKRVGADNVSVHLDRQSAKQFADAQNFMVGDQ